MTTDSSKNAASTSGAMSLIAMLERAEELMGRPLEGHESMAVMMAYCGQFNPLTGEYDGLSPFTRRFGDSDPFNFGRFANRDG